MGTDKKKEQKRLRRDIEKLLSWYTFEAEEDEIDTQVIEKLVALHASLEKQDAEQELADAKKAYERFLEFRETKRKENTLLADVREEDVKRDKYEEEEKKGSHHRSRKRPAGRSTKMWGRRTAIAAAVLIAMGMSGAAIGANAGEDSGFFHWLKKDETGVTMITSPEKLDGEKNVFGTVTYNSLQEVPEKYREYVVEASDLESLAGFEFRGVEVAEAETFVHQYSIFAAEGETKLLSLGIFLYPDGIVYSRGNYANYKYLYDIDAKETKLEVYSEEETQGTKYVICFYHENGMYYVQGEYELPFMEKLAEAYAEFAIK